MADEDALRRSARLVVENLPGHTAKRMLDRYTTTEELVDAIVDRGMRISERLIRDGRDLPPEDYPLLAMSLLSVKPKYEGVQENARNIVNTFDRLKSFGDVPLDVVVQARLSADHLVPLLVTTSRMVKNVRADAVPGMFVTMVAAAALTRLGLGTPASTVNAVLERGALLAARYRSRTTQGPGADKRFPVLGNTDLVGQIAAYRVALDEIAGVAASDDAVDTHATEVAAMLHQAMSKPWGVSSAIRGGAEPDVLRGFRSFAHFLGADAAEQVFVQLTPDLFATAAPPSREVPVEHGDTAFVLPDHDDAEDQAVETDDLTHRVVSELRRHTTMSEQTVLLDWITGARAPDRQDGLAFLVDRVRRVDRELRLPRPAPQGQERLANDVLVRAVRARVADAVKLGLGGGTLAQALLPPLWTNRSAVVRFVASKLRMNLGRGTTVRAKATLVASVVVRAPAQQVHRANDPKRSDTCSCLVNGTRDAPDPVVVCPHRPWPEGGRVEDYTTLTRSAEFTTESATRQQLRRYQGPWEHWVEEVRSDSD